MATEKGTFVVEFGIDDIDETFADYGLVMKNLLYNNYETPYKAVIKDGALVNLRSKRSVIIPNELIEEQIPQTILEQYGKEFIAPKK